MASRADSAAVKAPASLIAFGGQFLPSTMNAAVRPIVQGGWIPAITYTICALVVLLLTRGRLSYAGE